MLEDVMSTMTRRSLTRIPYHWAGHMKKSMAAKPHWTVKVLYTASVGGTLRWMKDFAFKQQHATRVQVRVICGPFATLALEFSQHADKHDTDTVWPILREKSKGVPSHASPRLSYRRN